MKKQKIVFHSQKEVEGFEWVAKTIDFGVSIAIMSAFNQMLNAYLVLKENGLLGYRVRKAANQAYTRMQQRKSMIYSTMKKRDFFDAFAEAAVDGAIDDIMAFKSALLSTLRKSGIHRPEMYAEVETARVLLTLAVDHFSCVLDDAKQKYGLGYGIYFKEYNVLDVATAWERVCSLIYPDVTIDMNNELTNRYFDELARKFAEGEYIEASLKEAMNINAQ